MLARTTKHTPADGSALVDARASHRAWRRHLAYDRGRIWAKHHTPSHRLEDYLASDDPDFEAAARGDVQHR
jgi:hypothetical protein